MSAAILNLQGLQLLRRFTCSWDPHTELMEPWVLNGHAYATNRHWAVRIPAAGLGTLAQWDRRTHPELATLFADARFDSLAPMQAFGRPTPCPNCSGIGRVTLIPCRHCDGKPFVAPQSPFECEHCEGTGNEPIPFDAASKRPSERCYPCDGTTWKHHGAQQVPYGSQWFMPGYLQVISELPGVLFATGTTPADPAAFAWDGGQGVLKPCHPPTKDEHPAGNGMH